MHSCESCQLPWSAASASDVYLKNDAIPFVVATYQYTSGASGNQALHRYCRLGCPLFVPNEIHHLPEEGTWSAVAEFWCSVSRF